MHVRQDGEFRVLVVDDERIIADSLALILNRSGFTSRAVYNGETALRVAAEWKPSALISDVVMSGMDGIKTAHAVRNILPACQILLISGHGTLDLFGQAGEIVFEILPKPVHPEALLTRLKALRNGFEHLTG